MIQVSAGHLEQFQCVIQTSSITVSGFSNWSNLGNINTKQRGLKLGLSCMHPIDVAPKSVNLTVMSQITVRVSQAPTSHSVCTEPGVDQRERRRQILVLQIKIELSYLVGHQQAFIDDCVAGHAADIEAISLIIIQP